MHLAHYGAVKFLRIHLVGLGFALLTLATGCGGASPSPTTPLATPELLPAQDYDSLVSRLRATGLVVEVVGGADESFFSGEGTALKVNGEDVQVFEYVDTESADAEAGGVSPDGFKIEVRDNRGVVATDLFWLSTPYFYQSGKLIVLYVGDTPTVARALEAALGPQFAGG